MQTVKEALDERSPTPLYQQLAGKIRDLIQEGQLRPGDRLEPERKMTEMLGISRRTVRSALAELIEGKYVEATHGRGNFVMESPTLKQLRILIPERFRPDFWGGHAQHYDLLHRAQMSVKGDIHYQYVPETEALEQLLKSPPVGFDAIVIFRPSQPWTDLLRRLASERALFPLPTVVVNRDLSGTGLSFVTADHFASTKRATEYLLQLGHRRIALLVHEISHEINRQTLQGFQLAMERALHPGEPTLPVFFTKRTEDGRFPRAASDIASFLKENRPTAVVLGGTVFVRPFEDALEELNWRMPDDLSAVACSERGPLKASRLDWTAFVEPAEEVTLKALEATRALTRNPSSAVAEILPGLLQEGSTCRHAGAEMAH